MIVLVKVLKNYKVRHKKKIHARENVSKYKVNGFKLRHDHRLRYAQLII